MFDGIHSRSHGGLDAFSSFGVSHHASACAVRDLDRHAHLLLAQFLHVEIAKRVSDAACSHELYPVCPILEVTSGDDADLVNCVGDIRTAWKGLIRR